MIFLRHIFRLCNSNALVTFAFVSRLSLCQQETWVEPVLPEVSAQVPHAHKTTRPPNKITKAPKSCAQSPFHGLTIPPR